MYMSRAFNFLISLESSITFDMPIHLPLMIFMGEPGVEYAKIVYLTVLPSIVPPGQKLAPWDGICKLTVLPWAQRDQTS